MAQVLATGPIKKACPLMTPAERLAIWEEGCQGWSHDAKDRSAHVEQGRDEAAREWPLYDAGTHNENGWPCGHRLAAHQIDDQGCVSQALAQTR
jgi:hypothetical protein